MDTSTSALGLAGGREDPSGPRVAVVAPEPMFTITVEQGADSRPEIHFHAGGQGFWVARMLGVLGARPVFCGPFGGESGAILRALVGKEHIEVDAVAVEQANGGYIHDRRAGGRDVVAAIASGKLSRHEADDFYDAALGAAIDCGFAVLTGLADADSLPAGHLPRLAQDLSMNGIPVVADVSGDVLRRLEAPITFVKVSHKEFIEAGCARENEVKDLLEGARRLHAQGVQNILVSRADAPAFALLEGEAFQVRPPQFAPLDHHGAGDSMTAAIAFGLASGRSAVEAVRLGAAAGAMNVTRHGLGSGRRKNIEQLTEKVELTRLRG